MPIIATVQLLLQ